MTLFEIEDGHKGGIFTPLSWDNNEYIKCDKETFMFNLNKYQKYKKLNKNLQSINGSKDCGPWTYDFGFYGGNMSKIQHYGLGVNKAFEKGSEILPNNSSSLKSFTIKEVEVFKIIIG